MRQHFKFVSLIMAALALAPVCFADDQSTDEADVKAVAIRYLVALMTGDATTAEKTSTGLEPKYLEAIVDGIASKRDIDTAVWARFARSGQQEKPITMLSARELTAKLRIVDLKINGEAATARVAGAAAPQVMAFKYEGEWKVDNSGLYGQLSDRKLRMSVMENRAAAAANREVARELSQGKYASVAEAGAAVSAKMRATLDADADYLKLEKQQDAAAPGAAPPIGSSTSGGAPAQPQPDDDGDAAALAGRTALVGGPGGGDFSQISPNGGPVLGFRYGFSEWGGHQVLQTFDPLFDAPGKGAAGEPGTKTIFARDGYVVGGLIVDADDVSAIAVRVMFVRFRDGRVQAKDTYSSAWLGIPRRIQQIQLAGTGEKVIGTFGRKGINVDALGLLLEANIRRIGKVGGSGGGPFAITGPVGSPVIGFRYSFGDWGGRKILRSFLPVFRDGAATNAADDDPGETLTLLSGRDGYVVRGLLVDTDDTAAVAVKVHFVRLKNGALDEGDTYQSGWVGIPSGIRQQDLVGGKGEIAAGTYGRKGVNLDALGLLVTPLPSGPTSRPTTAKTAR